CAREGVPYWYFDVW
nr:immunoglobulin heavy chain junction region [Mus musculus]MBK4189018.1 immunoglobulin heavy chain junction region [Mus musculus]MBK4189019.1 immunoglobulin heavy chain junction region [Mus musculus]